MTTIPNMNIVVQQGGSARDAQNVRNQVQNPNQLAAAEIPDKEVVKRTVVHESEEKERSKFEKDSSEKRKEYQLQQERKKKKQVSEEKKAPKETGRLLDTVV